MNSEAYTEKLNRLLKDLDSIVMDCLEPGWDGYDSLPVDPESHARVRAILMRGELDPLPDSIGIEPDGTVTIEWYRKDPEGLTRVLNVSVCDNGKLVCSLSHTWVEESGEKNGILMSYLEGMR